MNVTKFCCGGQNAKMMSPLFPMTRERNGKQVKFFTAAYKCHKCGEITLRGETDQLKAWTTFVEYLNADEVNTLIKEKEAYDRLGKGTANKV